MRCILIDPYSNTIREEDFLGSREDMYDFLSPPDETPTTCFEMVRLPRNNWLYIDEEGLFHDRKKGFIIPTHHQTLVGRGVILGSTEDGESWGDTSAPLMILTLTIQMVEFNIFKGVPH